MINSCNNMASKFIANVSYNISFPKIYMSIDQGAPIIDICSLYYKNGIIFYNSTIFTSGLNN